MYNLKSGMKVGARRWAYQGAHPGVWKKPWAGTVLQIDDPRAWDYTYAMGYKKASKSKVLEHLEKLKKRGINMNDEVPVLWDFGDEKKVHWEQRKNIRPYDVDFAEWEKERQAAMRRY